MCQSGCLRPSTQLPAKITNACNLLHCTTHNGAIGNHALLLPSLVLQHGRPRVVALTSNIMAVGTTLGATIAFQLIPPAHAGAATIAASALAPLLDSTSMGEAIASAAAAAASAAATALGPAGLPLSRAAGATGMSATGSAAAALSAGSVPGMGLLPPLPAAAGITSNSAGGGVFDGGGRGLNQAAAAAQAAAGLPPSGAHVMVIGDAKGEAEAVTALAFSALGELQALYCQCLGRACNASLLAAAARPSRYMLMNIVRGIHCAAG